MPTTLYRKPYRSPSDLIGDLKSKHLTFLNESEAERILSQISYYHFKIYLHPLLDPASRDGKYYRKGEFFEYGLELYRFDETLRAYLFSVIARLEVKLRSRLDHTLSSYTNNAFWYLDDTYFFTPKGDVKAINSIRESIRKDFDREKELYARNYKEKYHNNVHPLYSMLPPFWIASEFMTIGCLFKIVNAIDFSYFKSLPSPHNNLLNDLAAEFGARDFNTLVNWIQRLRDIRNRCAHHSRLWNARLAVPGGIANELTIAATQPNRPYLSIAVIQKMVKTLGMHDINMREALLSLFNSHRAAMLYLHDTGFPVHWENDPFWQ